MNPHVHFVGDILVADYPEDAAMRGRTPEERAQLDVIYEALRALTREILNGRDVIVPVNHVHDHEARPDLERWWATLLGSRDDQTTTGCTARPPRIQVLKTRHRDGSPVTPTAMADVMARIFERNSSMLTLRIDSMMQIHDVPRQSAAQPEGESDNSVRGPADD